MKISIAFVFVIMILFTFCSKSTPATAPFVFRVDTIINTPVNIDTTEKYYLALGDSYTIGASVSYTDRFPAQAVAKLKAAGINMKDAEIIAQTGWTTANLLYQINYTSFVRKYDVVSLLIGVNNQYQRRDTAEYRKEFTQLLQQSIIYARSESKRVFVLSIPDYSVTPYVSQSDKLRVANEIDAFNKINKQVCEQFKVQYLYITDESRKASADRSLIANDSLHFSGKAYQVWASMLSDLMKPLLK